jgi:hypothetical protein
VIDSRKAYEAMRDDMALMRAELTKLEGLVEVLRIPAVTRVTTNVRVTMIDLAARITELESNEAARRMCGEVPALVPQKPVDELPMFARATRDGHVLTADQIEAMQLSLHRAGDHTLDPDDLSDLNDDGEEGAR